MFFFSIVLNPPFLLRLKTVAFLCRYYNTVINKIKSTLGFFGRSNLQYHDHGLIPRSFQPSFHSNSFIQCLKRTDIHSVQVIPF